jgi:hypothetical protein
MANSSAEKPAAAPAANRLQEVDHLGQKIDDSNTEKKPTRQHWRDRLDVHPRAACYPLMSAEQVSALTADIKANGLRHKIRVYTNPHTNRRTILDGRNRAFALELLERELFGDDGEPKEEYFDVLQVRDTTSEAELSALVDGFNLHRRHLTAEQRRKLAAEALKANPEKSDRQIGKEVGAHHTTVAKERRKQEGRGYVSHVDKRTDTKGRRQPAAKVIRVKVTRTTKQLGSADQRKQVNAALEAVPDGASKEEKGSARWLCEFKYACEHYLPKMNAADRQTAATYAAAYSAKIDKAAP